MISDTHQQHTGPDAAVTDPPPRVLVVDDDPTVHRAFGIILRARPSMSASGPVPDCGYMLEHAYDGSSAIELVVAGVNSGSPFSVAFVDVRMVGSEDGIQVTRKLLAIDDSIEVVVCTAYSDTTPAEFRTIFGDTDRVLILKKPFASIEVSQLAAALTMKNQLRREAELRMHTLESLVRARTSELSDAVQSLESAAQRRAELEAQLALKRRLETVGRLAAGVSHEINTPLQFAGTSFEFVRDSLRELLAFAVAVRQSHEEGTVEAELDPQLDGLDLPFVEKNAETAIEHVEKGLSQVLHIVTTMKSFAHPTRGERTSFRIEHLLEDAITMSAHEHAGLATVERDYGDTPEIRGERGPLSQVFLNILVNAAQALRGARTRPGVGTLRVTTRRIGDRIAVAIEDDGPGIEREVLERIFDPFFTTKPVGEGTGQGLSVARTIVEQHDGEIRVRSKAGAGTTFEVELPIGLPADDNRERSKQ